MRDLVSLLGRGFESHQLHKKVTKRKNKTCVIQIYLVSL